MIRIWSWLAVGAIACVLSSPANAVIVASDDFNAEGGGVGFLASDQWGNLANGASSTQVASPAFRAFDPVLDPVSLSSGSVFISFDFSANQTVNWGGLAFFEGVDGGDETLFVGMPNAADYYGIDLKGDQGTLESGVPIDGQVARIVMQVEFGANNDTYRLWVNNLNQSLPNAEIQLDGFVIDGAWQSARVASDVGAGTFVTVDNLVISDSAADVGLVAPPTASVNINRSTGEITLSASPTVGNVVGYTLRSLSGSFDQAEWNTIDGRDATDATPPGNGTVDNDDWTVLTAAESTTDLSEFSFDATPGNGLSLTGTPLSLGNAWVRSPYEDVFATITVDDNGTEVPLAVVVNYTGGEILAGDLNGDGQINLTDWAAFKSGQGVVNGGMTVVEAYQLGDMDGNRNHDLIDFDLFVDAFEALNGAGSFAAALTAVPEPSSIAMLLGAAVAVWGVRRRAAFAAAFLALVVVFIGSGSTALAVIHASDDFSAPGSGTGWAAGDVWEGLDATGIIATHPNGGPQVNSFRNFAAPLDVTNALTYVRFDYRQAVGNGNDWGGFAFFEGLAGAGAETFFAGPNPGGTNNYAFDLKGPGNLDSTVPFNNQLRTIIGSIDTRGADTIYKIWVDNFNVATPNAAITITGQGPIDAPWQSLRFQSAGNQEFADNLWITDGAEESLIFQAPPQETLNLLVNKTTGEVRIQNNTGTAVNINAYSIGSGSGALNAGGAPGDFNIDGTVNLADYTVWRDNLGGDSAALNGNGAGDATVTVADYDLWKENFGSAGGGAGGWDSLAERDTPLAGFPQSNGNGTGWESGGNPSQFEVEEYRLIGQSAINAASSISLGAAYGGGLEGSQDLTFTYRSNGELVFGTVGYVTAGGLSAVNVPEPSSIALVLLAGTALLLAKRAA
jgi:hypothetical protein